MYNNFLDNPKYHGQKQEFISTVLLHRESGLDDYWPKIDYMLNYLNYNEFDIHDLYDFVKSDQNPSDFFDSLLNGNEYWIFSGYETIHDLKPYVMQALNELKNSVPDTSIENWPSEFWDIYMKYESLLRNALFNSFDIEDINLLSTKEIYTKCMIPIVKDIIYL